MQPVLMHQALIDERRRLGRDRHDEVWDGVIHMVPSASRIHQRIQRRLQLALIPIARRRGLEVFVDFDLMDPARGEKDYRQPDVSIVAPAATSTRAIQSRAELAIEIVSPHDESRQKLPFYAEHAREVWLLDPRTGTIEVFAGATPLSAIDGRLEGPSLGLELWITGHALVIRDGADDYSIELRDVPD